ncbi:hypothetical protein AB988_0283 [Acinetobacter baumannii]|nr:hypothetical protein AB994_2162 [Acinetobacter baumannii]KMV10967.1 hypothetical protein AB988_0283 [Acinetobacter baumannii]
MAYAFFISLWLSVGSIPNLCQAVISFTQSVLITEDLFK